MKLSVKWLGMGLVLLLASCAQPRGPQPLGEINRAMTPPTAKAAAPKAPTLPPSVAAALLPPMPTGKAAEEPRFDVSTRETPAAEFFQGLVAGTPYNMVVSPAVSGKISLTLKNVTVPEVMETVRSVYGYNYRRTPTGFMVLSSGMQTRVFPVNYLNLVRRGLSQTRVSSGQVSDTDNASSNTTNGKNTTSRQDKGQQQAVSGSIVDTETLADFWKELKTSLTLMVGNSDGRRVVVQPQANLVLVRALPGELDDVAAYLAAVQGTVERQVVIEAKIVEVELSDGYQTGINWAALAKPGANNSVVLGQTGGGTIFNENKSDLADSSGTLNPFAFSAAQQVATSAFGGVFSAAVNLNDFTAFIELLKSQGNVQVLSSPRISTVNNQKAVIKVGSDEFFVTDISSTTVTGTTTTTTPDITLTPFFSGIALDVTPQIDGDSNVVLHIHPTVSEVTDQNKEITVGGQTQKLPLAFSTVRESDSIVRAHSGQVVVIGGLMKNSETKDDAGVPLLGDLPGVGRLFRHTKAASVKSELVILLRPRVIQGNESWQEPLRQSREGVNRLGGALPRGW